MPLHHLPPTLTAVAAAGAGFDRVLFAGALDVRAAIASTAAGRRRQPRLLGGAGTVSAELGVQQGIQRGAQPGGGCARRSFAYVRERAADVRVRTAGGQVRAIATCLLRPAVPARFGGVPA